MGITSIDFLKDKLRVLVENVPSISLKYEYDQEDKVHLVEIKPLEVYENDRDYIDYEIDIEETFNEKFPAEEILFISTESLTEVKRPLLTLGNEFSSEFYFSEFILNFANKTSSKQNNSYALAA